MPPTRCFARETRSRSCRRSREAEIYLTQRPLELATLLARPRSSDGALCVFVGVVRDQHEGKKTSAIRYQAYDAMAEAEMSRIAQALEEEFPDARVAFQHRVGRLSVGEASVAVVASAPHREEAFRACRAAIDRIKKSVPIWKKEIRPDGEEEWVVPGV